jgi:hypothetical protein
MSEATLTVFLVWRKLPGVAPELLHASEGYDEAERLAANIGDGAFVTAEVIPVPRWDRIRFWADHRKGPKHEPNE